MVRIRIRMRMRMRIRMRIRIRMHTRARGMHAHGMHVRGMHVRGVHTQGGLEVTELSDSKGGDVVFECEGQAHNGGAHAVKGEVRGVKGGA